MNTTVGITTDNHPLVISDTERRSGLYILDKPRMGKSWLIINMILQDLRKGRGVFFLDPQGNTTAQIIPHLTPALGSVAIYDFEDDDKTSFLNPFGGPRSDPTHRNYAFAKTKAIFDKLWHNTFEEKPWLQLIIQNAIYAFIENQEYTLAEFPTFFRDREFREFLVSKMQYNMRVKPLFRSASCRSYFWLRLSGL